MIKVVPAPRPDTKKGEDEAYYNNIINRLGIRAISFRDGQFVECDTCAAKPGSPSLCAGCLANRYNMSK